MKKIAALSFILLILPIFAFAANSCTNPATSNTLGECVSQIYIWSMGAAAILALIMTVFGGYITLTAGGNAERSSRGKSYITSSLIGLALLFGAYIILNTINPDLTKFNFDSTANLDTQTQQTPSTTTTSPKQ